MVVITRCAVYVVTRTTTVGFVGIDASRDNTAGLNVTGTVSYSVKDVLGMWRLWLFDGQGGKVMGRVS